MPLGAIKMTIQSNGRGTIMLDGVDVSHCVRSMTFHATPGELPTMTLEIIGAVDVTAEARVVLEAYQPEPDERGIIEVTSITDTHRAYQRDAGGVPCSALMTAER